MAQTKSDYQKRKEKEKREREQKTKRGIKRLLKVPKIPKIKRPARRGKRLRGDSGKGPIKKRVIQIITRKEQPMPVRMKRMKVEALARQDIPLQRVSSTWIRELGYHAHDKIAVMVTRQGYGYLIHDFSQRAMTEWYYAMSKGTFFNISVKGKYTIERYR